ncbi:DNA damage-inducible protein D [Butyricicoccus faecihominis]|uniref:DNA damage-inducible protein D n=1 Tax=Butyricicoccus faecihominis TaxID=1712515 RepID=UPI002479B814|nr:DNA damage-inducible protein D [Butyricicoccus faecihominis]MCQ5130327.1 DNA damage-inducible protein D [Butyricicoccus faecihominis]
MDKKLISKYKQTFDSIMHIEDGVEFWFARELQEVLGYKTWEGFADTITRAQNACSNSGVKTDDHFRDVSKMVAIGSKAQRDIGDIMLTRYACYLIAQNGDPRKTEIAFAQTYFALQTRKQELIEQRLDAMNRLQLREQLKTAEKRLSQNIYERGVDDRGFGRIRSKGDAALFGGHTTDEMKYRYHVKDGRPLADFLPPVTIAAKSLATEMTNLNIDEKDLRGEDHITHEHVQNNRSVRQMLGTRGIRPESLPPAEDIKKLERRVKSEEKKLAKSETLPDLDK